MKTIKEFFICTGLVLVTLFLLISFQYGCKQKGGDSSELINLSAKAIKNDSLKNHCFIEGERINGKDTIEPLVVVEQMPDYPGGVDSLLLFLKRNLKYPQQAKKNGIKGTVYVSFVVERSGIVDNIKLLRGIGYGCDNEAIRVVKAMPRWLPGKQYNKNVSVLFNLPIKFDLK